MHTEMDNMKFPEISEGIPKPVSKTHVLYVVINIIDFLVIVKPDRATSV